MPNSVIQKVRYPDGSFAPFDSRRLEASLLAAAEAAHLELTWDRIQSLVAETMGRLEREHRACTPLLPGLEGAFPSPNGYWEPATFPTPWPASCWNRARWQRRSPT